MDTGITNCVGLSQQSLQFLKVFYVDFLFLDEIEELEKCSTISRTAYEATLMKYHPWVVQVQPNIRYKGTGTRYQCYGFAQLQINIWYVTRYRTNVMGTFRNI